VHQALDPPQLLPEFPAGVEVREILFVKTLLNEQGHRECVAERERGGRARGRNQVHRAGFLGHAAIQRDIRRLGERRARRTGDGNQPGAEPPNGFEQPEDFIRFAAIGERHDNVVALDHSEIAMDRFRRVEEDGRRAGAGERRGDLAADDA